MSVFKSRKEKEKLPSVIRSQGVEWWINLEKILFMNKKEDLYSALGQKQALILQMRKWQWNIPSKGICLFLVFQNITFIKESYWECQVHTRGYKRNRSPWEALFLWHQGRREWILGDAITWVSWDSFFQCWQHNEHLDPRFSIKSRIWHPKICHLTYWLFWAKGNWEEVDTRKVLYPSPVCLKVGHKFIKMPPLSSLPEKTEFNHWSHL